MKFVFIRGLILTFIVLGVVRIQADEHSNQEQTEPPQQVEQISAEETRQAQETADRFIKRFRETRDLAPIINEMFVSNFQKMLMEDSHWAGIVNLPFPLIDHLNEGDRLRCLNYQFSLEYMALLYKASKVPLDDSSLPKIEDVFPPNIISFFKANAPPPGEVKTEEQARIILSFLERAMIVMQEEVAKNPPEETAQFKKNLSAFEAHLDEYKGEKPFVTVSAKAVQGYSAGTRFISMLIPFHVGLIMVKEKGQYKILLAITRLPSN